MKAEIRVYCTTEEFARATKKLKKAIQEFKQAGVSVDVIIASNELKEKERPHFKLTLN